MNLGVPELLIVGFVVVLLFGTSKLPKLGASLGAAIRNFQDSMATARHEDKTDVPHPTDKHHTGTE
jgi:sec-independent protein translocase protein TatA